MIIKYENLPFADLRLIAPSESSEGFVSIQIKQRPGIERQIPEASFIMMRLTEQVNAMLSNMGRQAIHATYQLSEELLPSVIEIAPASPGRKLEVEMAEKFDRLAWLLYGDSTYIKPFLVKEEENQFFSNFNTSSPETRPSNQFPFEQDITWVNVETLYKHAYYYHTKQKELPESTESLPTNPKRVDTCVFCKEDIIHKQLMLDCNSFLVLVNNSPFGGSSQNPHFMIVPSNHVEDWNNLSHEQTKISPKVMQCLARSMQSECNISQKDLVGMLQNGVQAGQTVPHTHLHFFSKPNKTDYFQAIFDQLRGYRFNLSPDTMQDITQRFGPIFYQELTLEKGPTKSISFQEDNGSTANPGCS